MLSTRDHDEGAVGLLGHTDGSPVISTTPLTSAPLHLWISSCPHERASDARADVGRCGRLLADAVVIGYEFEYPRVEPSSAPPRPAM